MKNEHETLPISKSIKKIAVIGALAADKANTLDWWAGAPDIEQARGPARGEVLFDDRDERAGVKFKDADLVGIPVRIAIGKKGLASGQVEWKLRASKDKAELVPLAEVAAKAAEAVRAGTKR